MDKNLPEIKLPLVQKRTRGQGNSGYGSGLHDYTYINTSYFDQYEEYELFKEWDSRYIWTDNRWSVNELFEPLYNFFGEETFEDFIIWYFKLNIKDKGGKDINWVFE